MWGLTTETAANIGTAIGAALIFVVSYLGIKWGKRQQTPEERSVQVAGALVDASSVRDLTAAINRATDAGSETLKSDERNRAIGHKSVDAWKEMTSEIRELRLELRHFGDKFSK